MLISWSNLPARRKAASNESGRFVAPMIMTALSPVLSHDRSSLQYKDDDETWDVLRVLTIHACEELSDYSAFHFALGALSFGCDGINFIDE
jgi:hypothetical protein